MIEYAQGNLLEAEVEALVNTVNCVGFMGKGIALQFKQAFPENYEAYRRVCEQAQLHPGRMFIFETRAMIGPKYIINFPTKRHWRATRGSKTLILGWMLLSKTLPVLASNRSPYLRWAADWGDSIGTKFVRGSNGHSRPFLMSAYCCLLLPGSDAKAMPVRTKPAR